MIGFKLETTPDEKYCFIQFNAVDELCKLQGYEFKGSYNVVAARVAGLRYPQWLMLCAAAKGMLGGKTGYAGVRWKIENKAEPLKLIAQLNKDWDRFKKEISFNSDEL